MIRTTSLLLALVASPLAAQDTDGIQGIIDQQMDAFIARDIPTAFGFASPGLQQMFQTPQNFGHMVEYGYETIWNNEDVRYLDLRQDQEHWVQRVMVSDGQGSVMVFDYFMIEADGVWRIDAVQPVIMPQGMA